MSGRQVEYNLRRTMNKGLVSILNPDQLEQLAFKYFGVKNNNGEIIGYQCPYSGKIYYDYSNMDSNIYTCHSCTGHHGCQTEFENIQA